MTVPVLRSRAAAAEKAGQVPAGTLAALREAGLYLRDLGQRAAAARAGDEITVGDRINSRRGQAFAVSLADTGRP